MATAASTLITAIRRRVRDENATAHTQAFVRDLLDRSQVAINTTTRSVVSDTTLNTTAGQAIYHVETDLTAAITPERVLWNSQVIDQIEDWRELARMDRSWLVRRGDEIRAWTLIGHNLLVLYPALRVADTVTVRSSKVTAALSADATLLELPEELETLAMDLVTTLLLLRQRDLDMVEEWAGKAAEKMQMWKPVDWKGGALKKGLTPSSR